MKDIEEVQNEKATTAKPAPVTVQRQLPTWFPWVIAGLAALLIAMVAYGIGYQTSRGMLGGRGGMGSGIGMMRGGDRDDRGTLSTGLRGRGMMGGAVGEVTAVSSDSISIKDTMRGGSVTYKIDSSTKVTENGTTKTVSDIKTGDTVRVSATGGDTTIATTIIRGTY